MTRKAYEEYLSQKEWVIYNRGKISEYARNHPISAEEHVLLLEWLVLGHSIDSNPGNLDDASGCRLDYIGYLRRMASPWPGDSAADAPDGGLPHRAGGAQGDCVPCGL